MPIRKKRTSCPATLAASAAEARPRNRSAANARREAPRPRRRRRVRRAERPRAPFDPRQPAEEQERQEGPALADQHKGEEENGDDDADRLEPLGQALGIGGDEPAGQKDEADEQRNAEEEIGDHCRPPSANLPRDLQHRTALARAVIFERAPPAGGIHYYPSFEDKLTHLFFSACKFHCFLDGNKRIAITLCAQMLLLNGYLYCSGHFIREMENISYHVAAGNIDKDLLHEIITAVIKGDENDEGLKLKILHAIAGDEGFRKDEG